MTAGAGSRADAGIPRGSAGVGKRFGGTVALDGDRLVGRARRSALPGRRERLGQIDADQDPRPASTRPIPAPRSSSTASPTRSLTPHQARALGIQVIFQDLSLFPEPDGAGEYRHRPRARRRRCGRRRGGRCARRRRRRSPGSTPTCRSTPASARCRWRSARSSRSAAASPPTRASCSWTSRPPR